MKTAKKEKPFKWIVWYKSTSRVNSKLRIINGEAAYTKANRTYNVETIQRKIREGYYNIPPNAVAYLIGTGETTHDIINLTPIIYLNKQ